MAGTIERRRLLEYGGLALGAAALAACTTPNMAERPKPTAFTEPAKEVERKIKPFQTLPFRKQDLPLKDGVPYFAITQGWKTSKADREIANAKSHLAIDYQVPEGTICVAPFDCYVVCGFQEAWRTDDNEKPLLYKDTGLQIAYGGGIFLEMIPVDSEIPYRKQFQHLLEVLQVPNEKGEMVDIPFAVPKGDKKSGWTSVDNGMPLEELIKRNLVVLVKKGTPVGKVGSTGLGIGQFIDYDGGPRPPKVNPGSITTWDPAGAHLHDETMKRALTPNKNGTYPKIEWVDPYGIEGEAEDYPYPLHPKPLGKINYFFTQNGEPELAA